MSLQFASFVVDDVLYGVNILQVGEVLKGIGYSPVPGAHQNVLGLMNLRGQIVTIVDLAKSLGISSPQDEKNTCIIMKTDAQLDSLSLGSKNIERTGQDAVGLLVNRMAEVVDVDPKEIAAYPANTSQTDASFVKGVIKLEHELLTILSLERVLDFVN